MVNGDPGIQQPGYFGSGLPSTGAPVGQYNLPPTPLSQNTTGQNLPSVGGGSSNSPRPPTGSNLAAIGGGNLAGFSPSSIDTKQDIKQFANKLLSSSPSSGFGSQGASTTDSLLHSDSLPSLPESVKVEIKNEPLTSPMFDAGPTPNMLSQSQVEFNSSAGAGGSGPSRTADSDSTMNVDLPGVPSLPDSLPSIPNVHTPTTPAGEKCFFYCSFVAGSGSN